jgi:hypothetical protein
MFMDEKIDKITMDISISADEMLKWYTGHAQQAIITSRDGRSVALPVTLLHPFLTREGVHGRFVLYHDANYKCIDFKAVP